MLNDLSLISHATAAVAYALLAGLVATRYLRRDIDRSIFLAAVVSSLWAASLVTSHSGSNPLSSYATCLSCFATLRG